MTRSLLRLLILANVLLACLWACSPMPGLKASEEPVTLPDETASAGAFSNLETQKAQTDEPQSTPAVQTEVVKVWPCDCLPDSFHSSLNYEKPFIKADENESDYRIEPVDLQQAGSVIAQTKWVYLLAAPFPTLQDSVNFTRLKNTWLKNDRTTDAAQSLLVSESTFEIFSRIWGKPDEKVVRVLPATDLLRTAWDEENTWAIIPFEEIDPRWKIIRVNKISPLDRDFELNDYPLTVSFGLVKADGGEEAATRSSFSSFTMPESNLNSDKLTSLIMTGTTALVRYTALKMEENGILYPARDIVDLLKDADITHISNEASFYGDCPPAEPVRVEQRFCSDPAYLELLQYIDTDVIELTGNHILDWGTEPFLYTLQMYRDHQIPYYGGGHNLDEAAQPLTLQEGTQAITFIGCSPAGPAPVWAGADSAGSNPCAEGWMQGEIDNALAAGSIPVVTFQHIEVEDYVPHSSQRIDFQAAANMGAVIVSGSQSHFAQTMTFVGDHFVHYGLGNLFFDQMYGENPHEFVDRHYFYDGRYISTDLITLMLEDAAKPRQMTPAERETFLKTIFEHCNWETAFPAE